MDSKDISVVSFNPAMDDVVTINIEEAQNSIRILGDQRPTYPPSEMFSVGISSPLSTPLASDPCVVSSASTCSVNSYAVVSDGVPGESRNSERGSSVHVIVPPFMTPRSSRGPSSLSGGAKIHIKKSGSVVVKTKDPCTEHDVPADAVLITREMDDQKTSDVVEVSIADSYEERQSTPSWTPPPVYSPVRDKISMKNDCNQESAAEKPIFKCSDGSNILIKRRIGDELSSKDIIAVGATEFNKSNSFEHTRNTLAKKTSDIFLMKVSKSKQTCSLCLGVINISDRITFVPSSSVLPQSCLSTLSLLKCLGVCPPSNTIKQHKDCLILCHRCQSLLLEGDAMYRCLLTLTTQMKQRWLDVRQGNSRISMRTLKHGSKKHSRHVAQSVRAPVPILPKPQAGQADGTVGSEAQQTPGGGTQFKSAKVKKEVSSNKMLICGFCGMDLYGEDDFKLHSAAVHMIKLKWQQGSSQQTGLKMNLVREIQRNDATPMGDHTSLRKCIACGREYAGRNELVEHLRHYHNMTIDDKFLVYVSEAGSVRTQSVEASVRTTSSTSQPIGQGIGVAMKSEMVWEEVLDGGGDICDKSLEVGSTRDKTMMTIFKAERNCVTPDICESSVSVPDEGLRDTPVHENSAAIEQHETAIHEDCSATGLQETEIHGDSTALSPEKGQGGQWRCRLCTEIFGSQVEHDQHKLSRHPESVRVRKIKAPGGTSIPTLLPGPPHPLSGSGRNKVTCKMCGEVFENQDALDNHRDAAHCSFVVLEGDGSGGIRQRRINISRVLGPDEEEEENKGDTAETQGPNNHGNPIAKGSHVCGVCSKEFTSSVFLMQHRQVVHGKAAPKVGGLVMAECHLCGRKLHGTNSLRSHLGRVHRQVLKSPLKYRCKLCIFHCRTRTQLEKHMQEKHGANTLLPVRCKYCGKSYSAKYIDKHIANIHVNLKKFSCNFCSMKYNVETDLKAHIFYEHANNKWRCEICQVEFARYHQLSQHRTYIHSNKLFSCRECERTFKRKGDLTEHIKRRHQVKHPSKCIHCPKVYYDRKKLRTHLMTKHGVAWEDTLARTYARHQRESNCLRRHPGRVTDTQIEEQIYQDVRESEAEVERENVGGVEVGREGRTDNMNVGQEVSITNCEGNLEEQDNYNVVQVTEGAEHLADVSSFSYIILQES